MKVARSSQALRGLFLCLLALSACTTGKPREWVVCTATSPVDGRCTAWNVGRLDSQPIRKH